MKRKKNVDPNQLELSLFFAGTEEPHEAVAAPDLPSPPLTSIHASVESQPEPELQPEPETAAKSSIEEPRRWHDRGWTARVTKNDDDNAWTVEMTKEGDAGPALVTPWPASAGGAEPKPLDAPAFLALVNKASAERRRHEQQLQAMLHKSIKVTTRTATVTVTLDISPDEDNPYATLTAYDESTVQLAQVRVPTSFKLSKQSATKWIESRFRQPERL